MDLGLYIIDLKISKLFKNDECKSFDNIKSEITLLKQEKAKLYQNDKETIEKVFNKYLKDVE